MTSLAQQLASLRDERNKTLRKFLSEYKAAVLWNESEVSKSWRYIRTLDPAFERCASLFSGVSDDAAPFTLHDIFSSSVDELEEDIFKESKDVEFLTSEEFDELNRTLLEFFQLIVPYFLCEEAQALLDYLLFKYEAAVTFPENIIATFVLHHDSEYFCKLLSLITVPKNSEFHGLHTALKNVSLDFTEPKHVNRNVVFTEIVRRFGVYKRISTVYNTMARNTGNGQIVAFLNALNTSYVMHNHKTMDENEIRYVVNMAVEGLNDPENLEYVHAQMCLVTTVATFIQLTVKVQRELLKCLIPILTRIKNERPLSNGLQASLKNAMVVILACLAHQNNPMELLDEDLTHLVVDVLRRPEDAELVFRSISTHSEGKFARLTELLFSSLVHSHFAKRRSPRTDGDDTLARIEFLMEFACSTLGRESLEVLLFTILDSVNKIICQIRAHGERLIVFDEHAFTLTYNQQCKYLEKARFYEGLLRKLTQTNAHAVEDAVYNYLEALDLEELEENMELILFTLNAVGEDLFDKMAATIARFAEDASKFDAHLGTKCGKLFESLTGFPEAGEDIVNVEVLSTLVKRINSRRLRTATLRSLLQKLLASEDPAVRTAVMRDEFWHNVPVEIANALILEHIQKIVSSVDAKFTYGPEMNGPKSETKISADELLAKYQKYMALFKDPLRDVLALAIILIRIPHNSGLDPSVKHYVRFLKQTNQFEEEFQGLEGLELDDPRILHAMLLQDPTRKTAHMLISPFSLVAQQIESMRRAEKSDALENSQLLTDALMTDLVFKKLKEDECGEHVVNFVCDFYWLFVDQKLELFLDPKTDAMVRAKFVHTALSNKHLYRILNDKIKNRSSEVCNALLKTCLDLFRIFGLNGRADFQDQIKLSLCGNAEHAELNVWTPAAFKSPALGFDYRSMFHDKNLAQFITRTHDAFYEHEPANSVMLFENFGGAEVERALHLIEEAFGRFKTFKNEPEAYLNVLSNTLEYALFSEHTSKFVGMLAKLSQNIGVTRLRQSRLQHPQTETLDGERSLEVKVSVDLQPLLDGLTKLAKRKGAGGSETDLKRVVEECLRGNEALTAALTTNMFLSGANCIYNADFLRWLAGIIGEANFEMSNLFLICHKMLLALKTDISDAAELPPGMHTQVLNELCRTFPLVALIHCSGILKREGPLNLFGVLVPRFLDLTLLMQQRFGGRADGDLKEPKASQPGSVDARLGQVAHDLGVVFVYLLRDLNYWSLNSNVKRALYNGLVLKYGNDTFKFHAMLKWLFGDEADEKTVVDFIPHCLSQCNEHALMHLVKSVKSIKRFEAVVALVYRSNLNYINKAELACQIVTNMALSTDLTRRKVQAFVLKETRSLLEHYSRFAETTFANRHMADGGQGSAPEGHPDELNAFCTAITYLLNRFFVCVTKFNDEHLRGLGKTWNEFYHLTCSFVNISIKALGTNDPVRFVPLLCSTLAASVLHDVKANEADPAEAVRRAVTATVNNALVASGDYDCGLIEALMACKAAEKMHESVATTWLSYLAYLRVIRVDLAPEGVADDAFAKVSAAVAQAKEQSQVLTNLIWIALADGFELERLKVKLKPAAGIVKMQHSDRKHSNARTLETSFKVHAFVHTFLTKTEGAGILSENPMFSDRTPGARIKYAPLSQLAHALLAAYVMLEHEHNLEAASRGTIAEDANGRKNEFPASELVASTLALIFRLVATHCSSGGGPAFKVLAYGVLDAMLDNSLATLAQGEGSVWERERNFTFDYHMVFTLVRTVNKLIERSDHKSTFAEFKYERELERLHAKTTKALVDFFEYAESEHADAPSDALFRMVSYARTEIWNFFMNLPPRALEPLVDVLSAALQRLRNHHKKRTGLGWTYIDLVYSAKALLANGADGAHCAPTNLAACAQTLRETYQALLPLSSKVNSFVKLVLTTLTAWLMRNHQAALNREFYEFGLRLATEFDEYAPAHTGRGAGTAEEAFEEFAALSIADCLRAIEDAATLSCKALSRERLLTEIACCASRNLELKTVIAPFAKIDAAAKLEIGHRMNYTSRLMAAAAENIRASRPKEELLDDLRNLYLVCADVCAEFTLERFFAGGAPNFAEYNTSRACDPSLGALNPLMFTAGGQTFEVFEAAFIALALSYFRLISANALFELLEQQAKRASEPGRKHATPSHTQSIRTGVRTRVFLTVLLGAITEYGRVGATNLLITRLYQSLEEVAEGCAREAADNHAANTAEMAFDNAWTWFANGRLALAVLGKAVETWNEKRGGRSQRAGGVPDVVFNSWLKAARSAVAVFDTLPINGDMELDNITSAWSGALEAALKRLISGFLTNDDKIAKIEACLSDRLATRSLNVKIACLVLMNRLWDELGAHLSPTIRNAMPAVGELVDDENDLVRRIAAEVEAKINGVLHENE